MSNLVFLYLFYTLFTDLQLRLDQLTAWQNYSLDILNMTWLFWTVSNCLMEVFSNLSHLILEHTKPNVKLLQDPRKLISFFSNLSNTIAVNGVSQLGIIDNSPIVCNRNTHNKWMSSQTFIQVTREIEETLSTTIRNDLYISDIHLTSLLHIT